MCCGDKKKEETVKHEPSFVHCGRPWLQLVRRFFPRSLPPPPSLYTDDFSLSGETLSAQPVTPHPRDAPVFANAAILIKSLINLLWRLATRGAPALTPCLDEANPI